MEDLRRQSADLKKKLEKASLVQKQHVDSDAESSDSEAEQVAELPKVVKNTKPKARTSVSAEAFGKYNIKEQYTVKVV